VVKVTADEQGLVQMDAFQLTKTCLDMVAEDAILVMPERPGFAAVRETFTAIAEAKHAEVLDTDLLIKRVPITSHAGPFAVRFPRLNRDDAGLGPADRPTPLALKRALEGKRTPEDVAKAALDFALLVYLGDGALDKDTVCQIASELKDRAYPPLPDPGPEPGPDPGPAGAVAAKTLSEGYALLLREAAGLGG